MDGPSLAKKLGNVTVTMMNTTTKPLPSLDALNFWPWQVILISLYSTTAFISLASNMITIIVLLKGDRISSELWKFLINLCISDIAMSIFSVPFTYTDFMLGRWVFPPELCPVVQFAQVCSVFVSVWTLTIIGIDRYFAIVHPLYSVARLLHWLRSHKLFVISVIWLLGISTASAQLFQVRAVPFTYDGHIYTHCEEVWDISSGRIYTLFIFILTFAAPVVILIFVYSTIAYHILRHVIPGNPDCLRDENQINRKIKVIKMLMTIVLLFAICWLPIHVFTLLVWFYPKFLKVKNRFQYIVYVVSYFSCHFISMAHSTVNPICYCFMSENFRMNLRSIFNRCYLTFKVCRRSEEDEDFDIQGQTISTMNTRFRRTFNKDLNGFKSGKPQTETQMF